MKPIVMEPIQYNRCQVALMVKFAAFYSSSFAAQVGGGSTLIPKIVAGEVNPTPAILRRFGLEADGKSYVWNPR